MSSASSVSTQHAASILGVSPASVYDPKRLGLRDAVRHCTADEGIPGGQQVGLRWSRADLELVRTVMDACRLNCHQAARVVAALRDGRL